MTSFKVDTYYYNTDDGDIIYIESIDNSVTIIRIINDPNITWKDYSSDGQTNIIYYPTYELNLSLVHDYIEAKWYNTPLWKAINS